jgi:hypothetical protein
MYWYINIGVHLHNPREGLRRADGQTVQGGGAQRNPNPGRPVQKEFLLGRAKPHAGDGLRPNVPMLQHIFNTTTVETLAMAKVETGPKFLKHRCSQTLREDARELEGHRHVQDADITDGNVFPNEVEVDLDMLHTLILNRVGGEVDDADIVTIDESAL